MASLVGLTVCKPVLFSAGGAEVFDFLLMQLTSRTLA